MYSIFVVGAGYAGSRIAQVFAQKKQKVFALTRSVEKARHFEEQGIHPIIADLTKPETLKAAFDRACLPAGRHFIVICPAPDESTEMAYEAVYLTGVKNYLNVIKKSLSTGRQARPFLIVYLSSTGVWQDQAGDFFDETVVPQPVSPKAKILFQAEKQVLGCGLPTAILRLSGIYGPGRNRLQAFRDGKWPVSRNDRWMNLIHVDDIAEAMPIFLKSAKEGEVYLGSDDEPVLCSTLAAWLSEKTKVCGPIDFEIGSMTEGRRLKNTKFKELGIRLKYPTFREGYCEILRAEEGSR